jgi:hypothetical protein
VQCAVDKSDLLDTVEPGQQIQIVPQIGWVVLLARAAEAAKGDLPDSALASM